MPQLSYREMNCEETFKFFKASVLEYVRLIFHFLYRDVTNPNLAHFDTVFYGFMKFYDVHGLLPTAALQGHDDRSTVDFTDRALVHDSVFATSANAKADEKFDENLKKLQDPEAFKYDGLMPDLDAIYLPPKQNIAEALRTVAGEVIRSASLFILECDEFYKKEKVQVAANMSTRLKHVIEQVKGMECTRKLYYQEPPRNNLDAVITKKTHSDTAWFNCMAFYLFSMGLASAPVGNIPTYVNTLEALFTSYDEELLPLFDEKREQLKTTPKMYYCTQHYLLYWSHLILTHYTARHAKVLEFKFYCKHFNTTIGLNGIVEKKREREQADREHWNKRIGKFLQKEKRRKAYWVQNRRMRRDGTMLYIYSQKTRQPWRITHTEDPNSRQVHLYDNPTAASGSGNLPNQKRGDKWYRQGRTKAEKLEFRDQMNTERYEEGDAYEDEDDDDDDGEHPDVPQRGTLDFNPSRPPQNNKKKPGATHTGATHNDDSNQAAAGGRRTTRQEQSVVDAEGIIEQSTAVQAQMTDLINVLQSLHDNLRREQEPTLEFLQQHIKIWESNIDRCYAVGEEMNDLISEMPETFAKTNLSKFSDNMQTKIINMNREHMLLYQEFEATGEVVRVKEMKEFEKERESEYKHLSQLLLQIPSQKGPKSDRSWDSFRLDQWDQLIDDAIDELPMGSVVRNEFEARKIERYKARRSMKLRVERILPKSW